MHTAFLGLATLVSCIEAPSNDSQLGAGAPGVPPLAVPGTGGGFTVGSVVRLDATNSFDPDGTSLTYSWTLGANPTGLAGHEISTTPLLEFTLDAVGDYSLFLVVEDESGATDLAEVSVESLPYTLNAMAGADVVAFTGQVLPLQGSVSTNSPATPTYAWEFLTAPDGSTAQLENALSLNPSFIPDLEGSYTLRFGTELAEGAASDTILVIVSRPHVDLGYQAVDLEYSEALERFAMVSDAPAQFHLVDPRTGAEESVALTKPPTAVSLEPGGLRAAVGHDEGVSIVDLQTMMVVNSYFVDLDVGDLVFGADGRVHCLSSANQSIPIHSLDIATGVVTLGLGTHYRTKARLSPANPQDAYGANNGLSPSDIERYDFASDPVVDLGDSPYHGQYSMCGDLWFTDDGARIITRCRNVFHASDDPAVDMTYDGALAGIGFTLECVDHASGLGTIVALKRNMFGNSSASEIRIHGDQLLELQDSRPMPKVEQDWALVDVIARHVSFRSDESEFYVVVDKPVLTSAIFTMLP